MYAKVANIAKKCIAKWQKTPVFCYIVGIENKGEKIFFKKKIFLKKKQRKFKYKIFILY